MTTINEMFRNRIGFPPDEPINFDHLDKVLEKTALALPFENVRVMNDSITDISEESLKEKILESNEGGLCYDLNSILYLFLSNNGFNVTLIRGVVYNQTQQKWSDTGRTHAAILLYKKGRRYIVDTGFGSNLPLKPVPLSGETVSSRNGEFRIEKEASNHGNYCLYMKRKHKDEEWKKGYAFDPADTVTNLSDLNEMQRIIVSHPASGFNKQLLITKLTHNGSATLAGNLLTTWADGKMKKEEVDENRVKELAKDVFGLNLL
ncbi:arylamine N-acetyltransferase [Neobacillus notoginsengisoli]|uniref:Arylamine N-acetyltransferase n=1 Tax=Neobacillus notoginsengisoli TaxID=1578198 RepID=A0A417Z0N6_9BACI|nr:arylamine N-acetyltransferase [Neobacillus notoginsengisoli]RHW43534.1 arylamine N-acetyltransferase [Neobacillus notoginsengisoli]